MKTYTLRVTETKNKYGNFLYEIVDEAGAVLHTRRSNREYVAGTIDGAFFFGRLDLVGKGDHGRTLKYEIANRIAHTPVAYKK